MINQEDDTDPLQAFTLPADDDKHPALFAARVLAMPEHQAIREGEVQFGFLMRCEPKEKAGKVELGSVHVVKYMAQGAFKDLFFQLLADMLGDLPEYLVILDAEFWREAGDTQRLALMFHELKHVQQKVDQYGAPKFDRDGNPVFGIVEHDITAFNDELRRFGAWTPDIKRFLDVAAETNAFEAEHSHGF